MERVDVLVKLSVRTQALLGGDAADELHHDLPRQQWPAAPVVGDVAEHSVFDLVPLARARWEVAHLYRRSDLVGQVLQLHAPPPDPVAVAAAAVSGDQQALGLWVQGPPISNHQRRMV